RKTGALTNHGSTSDTSGVFSASIAGAAWTADSVTAVLVQGDHDWDKVLTITGFSKDKFITVSLLDTGSVVGADSSIDVKQYLVGGWRTAAGFAYAADKIAFRGDSVWQHVGTAHSGQATVSADDTVGKIVSGTFNFTARVLTIDSTSLKVDSLVVTNGVFNNVHYAYRRHRL
ncbi:MAG: hypothetical protein JST42_10885, partial [Bacteroidetes bacterium]|nr:hypothetical protein [Bacteroidota bacterium]